jgi:hypothetical protein
LGAAVGLVPVSRCCVWARCVRWVCGLRSLLLPRGLLGIRLRTWLCRRLSRWRLRRRGPWLRLLHRPDLLVQRRTVGQLVVTLLGLSWVGRFTTTLGVAVLLRRCLLARCV